MPAFHQDQVIVPPPGTAVVASSPACAYAALRYAYAPILSVQFHPEFSRPYLADLIGVLAKQDAAPGLPPHAGPEDRKSVGTGKSVSVRVDYSGRRIYKKQKKQRQCVGNN